MCLEMVKIRLSKIAVISQDRKAYFDILEYKIRFGLLRAFGAPERFVRTCENA